MKLGIINGVYANRGYDYSRTLNLATGKHPNHQDFKVDVIQLYLNPDNVKDISLLEKTREKSKKSGIELISHVHGLPSKDELAKVLIAHETLLSYQDTKRAVIHYEIGLDEGLLKSFNEIGITPCIENFHVGIANPEELKKHEEFLGFVLKTKGQCEIGAVLDFGRYLNSTKGHHILEETIKKIIKTYETLSLENIPVFFHTIGTKDFKQLRDDWVAPGSKKDLIPQKKILENIIEVNNAEGPLILESENVKHAVKGVEFFKKFMKNHK